MRMLKLCQVEHGSARSFHSMSDQINECVASRHLICEFFWFAWRTEFVSCHFSLVSTCLPLLVPVVGNSNCSSCGSSFLLSKRSNAFFLRNPFCVHKSYINVCESLSYVKVVLQQCVRQIRMPARNTWMAVSSLASKISCAYTQICICELQKCSDKSVHQPAFATNRVQAPPLS